MSLRTYREKRHFERTPEPAGKRRAGARAPIFVVQLHHASHRHYDFRLQVGDVLKSWAVPKGPSFDPNVKRLAMEVEDHPLEYARFEGIIPAGNYGAGDVRIFDHGTWSTDGDVAHQLHKGHLHFTLFGDKLRGAWDLIRTGHGDKPQWLLRKSGDDEAGPFEADDLIGDPDTLPPLRDVWHSNRSARTRAHPDRELAVVGYAEPRGVGAAGALVMGRPLPNGRWAYAGRVGAGMDAGLLRKLATALRPLERRSPPVVAESLRAAKEAGDLRYVHWIEPQLAVEVAARKPATSMSAAPEPQPPVAEPVRVTHGERLVYPEAKLTKADVVAYYHAVAPFLLPQVVGRPLAVVRCTDGVGGACFFQKHLKPGFGAHVHTVDVPTAKGREAHLTIEDEAGLLGLAQMNVIELHPWGCRVDDPDRADRMIFDLDPGEGIAWPRVVETARRVRKALLAHGLESYVRASGNKGLHVVVPLQPRAAWDRVRAFARHIAETLVAAHPDELVATMSKRERKGRIFVDHFRNTRGATSVASYSLRRTPEATVAMPLTWSDLGRLVGPKDFDLRSTLELLARRRRDPWEGIDEVKQSLPKRAGEKRD